MAGSTDALRWPRVVRILSVLLIFAVLAGCGNTSRGPEDNSALSEELVGTWFAYRNNTIENMWIFRRDGTCSNDGWPVSILAAGQGMPPYHLRGAYRVTSDRVEIAITAEDGSTDTIHMREPVISDDRLVYSVGPTNEPVVFLRERTAASQETAPATEDETADPDLATKIVGSWAAFADGFPTNTWIFNEDGMFVNEGWARLDRRTMLVRRLYQVAGKYTLSGQRVVLTNEKLLQFDPETNSVNTEVPLSERIVLYDVAIMHDRLLYTNEVGLPVVFRHGVVTPTNW